ncbi:PLD nuclease N-terminal domain-containing protein [Maribacter luteus]|uniref:PLD nuclease N-terminal domain-containing protein n=1 Tax=Maribacter luteus TaxID=2594478 RepID=UPI0024913E16|nr:PLD nuclease N-terminal domain-containing protein [Maribacter luteus]
MEIGFGIWQILILIIIAVLAIAPVVAIIDIAKGRFKGSNDKLIWILVVLFLNPLGTLLYFLMGKDQKIRENGN